MKIYVLILIGFLITACSERNSDIGSLMPEKYAQTGVFQLSNPQIAVDSLIFSNSSEVKLSLDLPNAEIRYTTNGKPVSENSMLYTKPIVCKEPTTINVQAFHEEFKASNVSTVNVAKSNNLLEDAQIVVRPSPKEPYLGYGEKSLVDKNKGTLDFKANENWLGFQAKEVSISVDFSQEIALESVTLSLMRDQKSWVFFPRAIEIWAGDKMLGSEVFMEPNKLDPPRLTFAKTEFEKVLLQSFVIKIKNLGSLPDWHLGSGNLPWLFMDEIIVR